MSESEEFVGFMSDISYHVIQIGRFLAGYMMRREMSETMLAHSNGHTPDPYNCAFCKYERDVVGPRDAARAREAVHRHHHHHKRVPTPGGHDSVDGHISQSGSLVADRADASITAQVGSLTLSAFNEEYH